MHSISALLLTAALAVTTSAAPNDWPQFRGPEGNGVSATANIPAKPKIEWSAPLPGRGLASPIAVGNLVYVACSSGPKQERLHLIAFDAANGEKRWERQLQATGRTMTHPKTAVAACTPCSDGKRIFALWSSNDLAAFDVQGNLLWVRGLTADYPNVSNSLGMASSLLVIGDTLVTVVENDSESCSLGIDATTGRNLWKLDRPKSANWTSPVAFQQDATARPIALLQSSKGLTAVDPETGSQLWEYAEGASTMSSSAVAGGVIYTPSNGLTALAPKADNSAPEQLWRARQINPSTISPLVLGGKIYSINGAGVISTADAKTGALGWKLRVSGPFSGSPVGANGKLAVVSEKGLVQIVDVSGAEGVVAGQLQLPLKEEQKELVLCTPALSGGNIYVRADSMLWKIGAE